MPFTNEEKNIADGLYKPQMNSAVEQEDVSIKERCL